MNFHYNDGGRSNAGFKGRKVGDCVVRAIAITSQLPYADVHRRIKELAIILDKPSNPDKGVDKEVYHRFLLEFGAKWTPTMGIGTGCKVHLKASELPMGRLIVRASRHLVAVIDGEIHDIYNPTRGGNRCVYGYYIVSPE